MTLYVYVWLRILGWAEKWKNDILKKVDVDYYGNVYIKEGFIEKITLSKF